MALLTLQNITMKLFLLPNYFIIINEKLRSNCKNLNLKAWKIKTIKSCSNLGISKSLISIMK